MNNTQRFLFRESLPHPTPSQPGKGWLGEQLLWTWSFSKHWHKIEGLEGKKKIGPWESVQLLFKQSMRKILAFYVLSSLFWTNRGCQISDFLPCCFFPTTKICKEFTGQIQENFSKTSQDIAASNAINALVLKLSTSGLSVSEKRRKSTVIWSS